MLELSEFEKINQAEKDFARKGWPALCPSEVFFLHNNQPSNDWEEDWKDI